VDAQVEGVDEKFAGPDMRVRKEKCAPHRMTREQMALAGEVRLWRIDLRCA